MSYTSVLDNLEASSSALEHAVKLQTQAAKIGFDWADIQSVFSKLTEEVAELQVELAANASLQLISEELGDILFVCVNLARHLKIDPEDVLIQANKKFERRFRLMEEKTREKYPSHQSINLTVMDEIWDLVKQEERESNR